MPHAATGARSGSGRCWQNATWLADPDIIEKSSRSVASFAEQFRRSFAPPPEHAAFLRESWRFSVRLEEVRGRSMAVAVPLGFAAGDSFYVTVPLHEDDPDYDPNGVGGVPYGDGTFDGFRPPVRVTVPPKGEWTVGGTKKRPSGVFRMPVWVE